MSIEWITILLFASMLLVLASGLPIAFGLGGLAVLFALWLWGPGGLAMILFGSTAVMGYGVLVCVPLFIFMGMMLSTSGIADDLYATLQKWLGFLPGSLAVATIGVCTAFAAMVGSVEAGTLTMGTIALPIMLRHGYHKELATGCIQAGGALGFLIPPSIIAILYALIARESVGQLLAGGLVPGVMLSAMFIIYIMVRCSLQPHLGPMLPPEERAGWREKFVSVRGVILPILLILSVLGSIFLGLATPVEASAIGAIGSILCTAIHRKLTFKVVKESLTRTLRLTGMVAWIFIAALTFGKVYAGLGAKKLIETVVTALPMGPMGVLILIQLSYFILGMVLDDTAILFICMPIYAPLARELGFDLVWFGVLYLVNMQMAYLTPPFGYALFLMKGVAPKEISMIDIYRSVWPFVVIQGTVLVLCILFPELILWFPRLMFSTLRGGG